MKCVLVILGAVFLLASCSKAGFKGDVELSGHVAHHEQNIAFADVYIKANVTEFPGEDVSAYDKSTQADDQGHYHFAELQKGDYYLWSVGFDSSINELVKGGVPVTISEKSGNKSSNIPVTE